jgi:hypothetical protein
VNRFPPSCDPLVQHFVAMRAEYEAEVDRFLAGPFSEGRIEQLLGVWTAQMQPFVAEAATQVASSPDEGTWAAAVQTLREKINSARQHRGRAYF